MSSKIITGTIGSLVDLNAPFVTFNLTLDTETHKVNGSVQISTNPPEDKPYSGNVTGTVYATGYGPYVQVIALQGTIPSNNPITPIEFPFNAHMALEAGDKGVGGFNFQGKHLENQPVRINS